MRKRPNSVPQCYYSQKLHCKFCLKTTANLTNAFNIQQLNKRCGTALTRLKYTYVGTYMHDFLIASPENFEEKMYEKYGIEK
jgi:hypothetical protein